MSLCTVYCYGGARTVTDKMFAVARYYDISPKTKVKNRHIAHLYTRQNKINILFGPDQSKWTSGFSWCEYTLKSVYSWHGDESSRTVSDFFTRLINYDS